MRLEKDKFLTELTRLYDKTKEKGSVFITMKRSNEKPLKGKDTSNLEYKCLIRATDGRKKKISTVVSGKEVVKFQDSFDTILKANMDNLKKRERKKARK
eukprot:jgi/Picsp_1/6724/NSC_04065-R1_signal recognition particle 14 kda protein